jgi:hypothetical protein
VRQKSRVTLTKQQSMFRKFYADWGMRIISFALVRRAYFTSVAYERDF